MSRNSRFPMFQAVLSLLMLSVFTVGVLAQEPFAPPQPGGPKAVLIQFHRGGGNDRPEGTLETFEWAWHRGAIPEADARLTKDGVAISFHDDNLARIPSDVSAAMKKRKIKDLNWDEIKDLDVGSYIDPKYSNERIATMESIFKVMQKHPERYLYLDEKGATPELMAKMSKELGVQNQVIFASTNYDLIVRWKKIAPEAKALHWMGTWNAPLEESERLLQKRLDDLEKVGFAGIDILQIHVLTDLSKDDPFIPSSAFLRRAGKLLKKHGVIFQSLSWTNGDKPETYRRLIELGVQSFATDYPDACLEGIK